ncbi:MAG: hypothetical protein HKO02_03335 [Hyphomonadaceae bacterium]|nr:hypothetical protein [Hyphomonadaceae bacterium]
MLLRSITKHVRDQNWFAVFLDFFIVVAGILIAFQITNWNDARKEEQAARVYVERIRDDLMANREDLQQRAIYFSQTRDHALSALAALDRPPETLGKDFLIDVYQATQALPRTFGRDTYDEIISAGETNTITDTSIRKMFANFYRGIEAPLAILSQTVHYREIIRSKMPYKTQAAIRADCAESSTINAAGEPIISFPDKCEIDLDMKETLKSVSAIIDADIRDALVRRISDLDNKIVMSRRIIERAEALDAHLEERL